VSLPEDPALDDLVDPIGQPLGAYISGAATLDGLIAHHAAASKP
jgi:hypothetical protein